MLSTLRAGEQDIPRPFGFGGQSEELHDVSAKLFVLGGAPIQCLHNTGQVPAVPVQELPHLLDQRGLVLGDDGSFAARRAPLVAPHVWAVAAAAAEVAAAAVAAGAAAAAGAVVADPSKHSHCDA